MNERADALAKQGGQGLRQREGSYYRPSPPPSPLPTPPPTTPSSASPSALPPDTVPD